MPKRVSAGELARMTAISFIVLAISIAIAGLAGDLGMRPGRMHMPQQFRQAIEQALHH